MVTESGSDSIPSAAITACLIVSSSPPSNVASNAAPPTVIFVARKNAEPDRYESGQNCVYGMSHPIPTHELFTSSSVQ